MGNFRGIVALAAVLVTACTPHKAAVAPHPVVREPAARMTRASGDSINSLQQQNARLELRLLEQEAQVGDLQAKLDEARQEVVRAMAKLQTLASKAEAASGMAEAEIALQQLHTAAGQGGTTPEGGQAEQLLHMSTKEFDQQNYGGALYLANQAKNLAGAGQSRLTSGRGALRQGEVQFAVPLHLQTLVKGNVRDGPGANFKVLFTLDAGTSLLGYAYSDVWVRVGDESGRGGWIFSASVGRRQAGR